MIVTRPRRFRPAFTLLEIIVALGLSVIIVGAISSAIRLHLLTLEKQTRNIEYKQIARTVLMMISNDLRNAVQYKPVDLTVLEQLAQSQQAMLGNTGGAESGVPGGEANDESSDSASSSDEEAETITMDESLVEGRPTMIGDVYNLSIDISRVPRLDEYNSLTAGDVQQLPSDIKNVTYFVSDQANGAIQPKFEVISNSAKGGLYRRAIDRAFATYRDEQAPVVTLDEYAELIAPEIAQVTFRYFDGDAFQEEWDSAEMGSFPLAIEVILVIDPERINAESNYRYGGFDPETMQRFRLVVNLPTAELTGGTQ